MGVPILLPWVRERDGGRRQGVGALARPHVVLAWEAGGAGYRQLPKGPSEKPGEGGMLAGDDKPHRGKTIAEAVWAELAELLKSKAPDDVLTAIHELDE